MKFKLVEEISLEEKLTIEGKDELYRIVKCLRNTLKIIPSWKLRKESKDNSSYNGLVNQATDFEIKNAARELGFKVVSNPKTKTYSIK